MTQTRRKQFPRSLEEITFESSKCRFILHSQTNDLYVCLPDLLRLIGLPCEKQDREIAALSNLHVKSRENVATLLSEITNQRRFAMTSVQQFWFDVLMRGYLLADHVGWEGIAPTRKLYQEYLISCNEQGLSKASYPVANNIFTKHIKAITPKTTARIQKRFHYVGNKYPTSEWCLRFDDLDVCRETFNLAVGRRIMWRAIQPPTSEET